jgi:hypothetical protein
MVTKSTTNMSSYLWKRVLRVPTSTHHKQGGRSVLQALFKTRPNAHAYLRDNSAPKRGQIRGELRKIG